MIPEPAPIGTRWTLDGSSFLIRARGRAVELASGALALGRFASEARFLAWFENLSETSARPPEFASEYNWTRARRAVLALKCAEPVESRRSYSAAEKREVLDAYEANGRRDRAGVAGRHGFSEGALARLVRERNRARA